MTTIYALSSGRGRAGVAVFRVSGPEAAAVVRGLTGRDLPPPRTARLNWLKDPASGERLDQGLVLWFPEPHSFTGEDVVEIQCHGGTSVIAALTKALGKIPGTRPAEAGEFSKRAFHNGRFDLTAAEGLADLINAETEGQRRQALRQMAGEAALIYDGWRRRLTEALAMFEAAIDFADEDLPDDVAARGKLLIDGLRSEMLAQLADDGRGERLRDGMTIAIVGAPNVGKSSLLNALARRDVAIVSDRAGTTRDVIEVHLDLGGLPVVILDTAGLRDSADDIEQEGIRRALARADSADLCLVMVDARDWPMLPPEVQGVVTDQSLLVVNKTDLVEIDLAAGEFSAAGTYAVSVRSGTGIEALVAALQDRAEQLLVGSEAPVITRARHRQALEAAVGHLQRFLAGLGRVELELQAEDIRLAARELGRITGRIEVEDVLDVIFSEFCIGK